MFPRGPARKCRAYLRCTQTSGKESKNRGPETSSPYSGLKTTTTGDSICDPNRPLLLEPVDIYEPVISVSVEAQTRADQEKLFDSLAKLSEEDPTFRFSESVDTGQIIVSGMGELHLEIVLNRLARDYHVNVNAGKPQVVYRETISRKSEGTGVFDREIGGTRHFAQVQVSLAPMGRGLGASVVNKVRDGSIPELFFPSIEQGIQDALGSGTVSGYPVVDVETTVFTGIFQEGVSSELAFRVAASMAFRNAFEQADPVLLEPCMLVEILTPDESLGEVVQDINMRKGKIENISASQSDPGGKRRCVPFEDVWLFYCPSLVDPGAGDLHHAFFSLRSRLPIGFQWLFCLICSPPWCRFKGFRRK